ncbi:hypothetical protein TNCV_4119761 [Trichonephila clavipes]|nr:hypothetical protein TNCV_4119761 [Trichonephila clavipes]
MPIFVVQQITAALLRSTIANIVNQSRHKDHQAYRHPIHLQWSPSHVDQPANDFAKAAASDPVDSVDRMIHTSTKIYSRDKELICRAWFVPPVHP